MLKTIFLLHRNVYQTSDRSQERWTIAALLSIFANRTGGTGKYSGIIWSTLY